MFEIKLDGVAFPVTLCGRTPASICAKSHWWVSFVTPFSDQNVASADVPLSLKPEFAGGEAVAGVESPIAQNATKAEPIAIFLGRNVAILIRYHPSR